MDKAKLKERIKYLESKLSIINEFNKYKDIPEFHSFISWEVEKEEAFELGNEDLIDSFMRGILAPIESKAKTSLEAFYKDKKSKALENFRMALKYAKDDYEQKVKMLKLKYLD